VVLTPEHISDPLHDETALDKVIKADSLATSSVKLAEQKAIHLRAEVVTKGGESLLQLRLVYCPRLVLVKSLETVLPIDHISPESSKFCVANLTRLVFVKQTYHAVDGDHVELCAVAIDQGLLQLGRRDCPRFVCINSFKVALQLIRSRHVWRGWGGPARLELGHPDQIFTSLLSAQFCQLS